MLTLEQLTRLKEVCETAKNRASHILGTPQPEHVGAIYRANKDQATAALADIDAELALLKGAS